MIEPVCRLAQRQSVFRAGNEENEMTAFEKIAAGLADAIAYAEGDMSKGRIAAGPDVKAIRAKTKLSQSAFAAKLRVPAPTIRDWEQGRRSPEGAARTLLSLIAVDHVAAFALLDRAWTSK